MQPDYLGMMRILIPDARIGELSVAAGSLEGAGRSPYMVQVQSLPNDEMQPIMVFIDEHLIDLDDLVDAAFRQISCKGLQPRAAEH